MGVSYFAQNETQNAIIYFEKALSILKKEHGERHLKVAHILVSLGDTLKKAGDAQKALVHFQKAISILEQLPEAPQQLLHTCQLKVQAIRTLKQKPTQNEEQVITSDFGSDPMDRILIAAAQEASQRNNPTPQVRDPQQESQKIQALMQDPSVDKNALMMALFANSLANAMSKKGQPEAVQARMEPPPSEQQRGPGSSSQDLSEADRIRRMATALTSHQRETQAKAKSKERNISNDSYENIPLIARSNEEEDKNCCFSCSLQ